MSSILELSPIGSPVQLPSVDQHSCVSSGVTARGEVAQLWVPRPTEQFVFEYDERPGFARFPKSKSQVQFSGMLVCTGSLGSRTQNLIGLDAAFPHVDVFPNGDVLVCSARCHKRKDGSVELNARIYGTGGAVITEFCLGDGIEHLGIDGRSRIWAGYSDEGVYGNYGWGTSSENSPIGAFGIVCFNNQGQKLWEYKPPQGFDYISDCYTLNCADDAVWACTYTDFPMIRIDDDLVVNAWHSDLSGPKAIAVNGKSILAFGGYRDSAWDCSLLRVSGSRIETVSQVRLMLPAPVSLHAATVIGRGKFLSVIHDGLWFQFDVPR